MQASGMRTSQRQPTFRVNSSSASPLLNDGATQVPAVSSMHSGSHYPEHLRRPQAPEMKVSCLLVRCWPALPHVRYAIASIARRPARLRRLKSSRAVHAFRQHMRCIRSCVPDPARDRSPELSLTFFSAAFKPSLKNAAFAAEDDGR
jgi:hypothetical protein